MEQLIPIINKLQDAFALVEGGSPIDLPQIVVVGSQSSGKSSVLENIVGKDFLPRGSGIVTRRPLILQLIHTPSTKGGEDLEWGEFLHTREKFYDFGSIKAEIERETDRLTGKNKGISHTPINLKVYSPHVLNLTLVDLPGITKVPIGDQPKDIESQIRQMIFTYISRPNAIILAVTAANTDLTNSDSLHLAREVDPEGKRTVGVITKLDLMDKGTDALDMLMGRVVPLRLGYIGVVNRSQQDINSQKSISSALQAEKEFFNTHPIYKNVSSRCGTQFLASSLNKVLMTHIRDCVPDLKHKLNQLLAKRVDELQSYGDARYDANPGALLLSILNMFSGAYNEMIEGKANDEKAIDELYGGARINYIFNEIFAKYLTSLSPLDGLTPFDIRTAISNATGPKAALFVPEQAFELLARRQIARLREPGLQCVDLIYEELERIVHSIRPHDLSRFANLREEIVESATNLLKSSRDPAKEMINNICNMELAFINTSHPDFQVDKIISGVMQKRAALQQQQQQPSLLGGSGIGGPSNSSDMMSSNTPNDPHMRLRNDPHAVGKSKQPQPSPPKSGQPSNMPGGNNPGGVDGASGSGFLGMFFGSGYRGGNDHQQQQQQQQQMQQQSSTSPRSNSSNNLAYPNNNNSNYNNDPYSQQQQQGRGMNAVGGRSNNYNPVKLQQVPATLSVSSIPPQKEFEIDLLESLMCAYFDIVRKNIQDSVPKAVMYFMVNKSKAEMQNELVQRLYKESAFEHLLAESSDIVTKRKECKEMLEVLRKAQGILNEVRDFALPMSHT